MFDRARRPIGAVARAAVRPETYPAHVRELASFGITASMWPLGLIDRGVAEVRRLTGAEVSAVATPVLLVHGYGANKSNWMFLQRDLRAAGFGRVHAVNYNPLAADIPAIADATVRRARQLMDAFGTDRVHLIGHSLGGVVGRYAVQIGGLEEAATCLTVASPHRGVMAAHLGWGTTARQLRPGSAVLRRLSASSRRLPTRFVAYYSNLDLVVPGRRAMILEPALRASNVLIKDEGHLSILLARRLSASVRHELGAAEGLPGYGSGLAGLPSVAAGAAPVAEPPSLWTREA